jgi:hypothetical protein
VADRILGRKPHGYWRTLVRGSMSTHVRPLDRREAPLVAPSKQVSWEAGVLLGLPRG